MRKKLQTKHGLLKTAFQSIADLPGGYENAQGELVRFDGAVTVGAHGANAVFMIV